MRWPEHTRRPARCEGRGSNGEDAATPPPPLGPEPSINDVWDDQVAVQRMGWWVPRPAKTP